MFLLGIESISAMKDITLLSIPNMADTCIRFVRTVFVFRERKDAPIGYFPEDNKATVSRFPDGLRVYGKTDCGNNPLQN
jgi:hypothetical protein